MNNYTYKILLLFLLIPSISFAQKDSAHNIASRIYFPFDLGYAFSSNENIKNSMITKMGLEFRIEKNKGGFIRGNWDTHSHDYKISENNTTNVIVDKLKFDDFTLGYGYRFGSKKLKITSLLQAGFSILSFNKIEGMTDNYRITEKSIDSRNIKYSSGLEYSINSNLSVNLESSYILFLENSVFLNDNMGFLSFGIGLTTSFY